MASTQLKKSGRMADVLVPKTTKASCVTNNDGVADHSFHQTACNLIADIQSPLKIGYTKRIKRGCATGRGDEHGLVF